ncbi:MAG TPA: hypothetical protein VMJ65_16305 [Solirubrobacteraceae bacterium]|nr:hypothetical protein [Solirubrobacteraceae bacterium]
MATSFRLTGRVRLRSGPLRGHRAAGLGPVLPLHPLPAPHGHGRLGERPAGTRHYAAPWEPVPDDGLPRYPERRLAD